MDSKHTDTARRHDDRRVDESLDETFPASDPPAHSGVTTGTPEKDRATDSAKKE